MHLRHRLAPLAMLTVAAVVVTGCAGADTADTTAAATDGSGPEPTALQTSGTAESTSPAETDVTAEPGSIAEFNETDVSFAAHMLPHHMRGVSMAELAVAKSDNPEVEALAQSIIETQSAEIETLQGFLDTFGAEPAETAPQVMPLNDRKRAELEAATGVAFDRMFLTMMSTHHASGVVQAETELAGGQYRAAQDLAGAIRTTQLEEIAQMNEMVMSLG